MLSPNELEAVPNGIARLFRTLELASAGGYLILLQERIFTNERT